MHELIGLAGRPALLYIVWVSILFPSPFAYCLALDSRSWLILLEDWCPFTCQAGLNALQ